MLSSSLKQPTHWHCQGLLTILLTSFLAWDHHNLWLNLDLKELDFDGDVLEKNAPLGLEGSLGVNCNLRFDADLSRDILLRLAIHFSLRLPHLFSQLVHPHSSDLALQHKLPQLAIEGLQDVLTWATSSLEDLSDLACSVPFCERGCGHWRMGRVAWARSAAARLAFMMLRRMMVPARLGELVSRAFEFVMLVDIVSFVRGRGLWKWRCL